MKNQWKMITILLFGVCLFYLFTLTSRTSSQGDRRPLRARSNANSLWVAVTSYNNEYGQFPPLTNAVLLRLLCGENPKKIVFFAVNERDLNKSGEFLDPWGTPYRILLEKDNVIVVRSAGKNRAWGDQDDLSTRQ